MPQIKNQSVTNLKVGKVVQPAELAAALEPAKGKDAARGAKPPAKASKPNKS